MLRQHAPYITEDTYYLVLNNVGCISFILDISGLNQDLESSRACPDSKASRLMVASSTHRMDASTQQGYVYLVYDMLFFQMVVDGPDGGTGT